MFANSPITPVAFFMHSRRFQDHVQFVQVIRKSLLLLAEKKLSWIRIANLNFQKIFHSFIMHSAGTILKQTCIFTC